VKTPTYFIILPPRVGKIGNQRSTVVRVEQQNSLVVEDWPWRCVGSAAYSVVSNGSSVTTATLPVEREYLRQRMPGVSLKFLPEEIEDAAEAC